MPRPTEIQNIIEGVVGGVLASALPGLRAEIVRRAAAELESLFPAPGASPTDILNAAAASIQEATSQAEILRHLLEGEARFAGRVALFVVRGSVINGWMGTGFQDNEVIKNISLNTSAGLVARVIQSRTPAAGATAEFDQEFMNSVLAPVEDSCVVLPLVVKQRVAALLYADGGAASAGALDASALWLLTRWAALWLELSAVRKVGAAQGEEAQPAAGGAASPVSGMPAPPAAAVGSEEADLHKKAQRFAKLLVEEIKLYNQPKVVEGKHNRDLYDRLREDIEKSRATYQKRYGETPVASANYFNQELVRILADNDISLMGAGFPR